MLKLPKRTEKEVKKVPKSAQQSLPISRIHKDGTWEVKGRFTRSWKFTDINFSVADDEDKKNIIMAYASFCKALPTDAITKITLANHHINLENFQTEVLLPQGQNQYEKYLEEYNQMLLDKSAEGNNITKERYITVSVERKSIEEAKSFFIRIGNDLANHLKRLGSNLMEMNNYERLEVLHDFFRSGEEGAFQFDFNTFAERGQDFRDNVCPDSIQFHSNYFELSDNKVGRVLFFKNYPNHINVDLLKEVTDLPRNLMLSIDISLLPTDVALKEIQNKALAIETDITRWQNKQNQHNNFSAIPPMQLTDARDDTREVIDDINTRDQRITKTTITLVHLADSKGQLDEDTDTIKSIAGGRNCEFSVLTYQQEDGLNTVLPYGTRAIEVQRTFTTESLAAIVPFSSQEIRHKKGVYYGVNATSHNLILCNRLELINANGFIFGVSGSGKSFAAKNELTSILMATNDDIIVVDPEREYHHLAHAFGGEVVKIAAGSPNHINPLDMVQGYGDDDGADVLSLKTEYITSLCEQVMEGEKVGAHEKSIIDRCVKNVYRDYLADSSFGVPTLKDFRREIMRHPETEAQSIALSLERFTDGVLDIFSHSTNVDMNNRFMVFDIFDLGSQMKTVGMLVMLDAILNRVIDNHKKGKRTWIYIDEIYLFFKNEYSTAFLEKAWKRFRKKGAAATGITQNVTDCLNSSTAKNMLANSEFLLMFSQAPTDMEELTRLLHISNEQIAHISNAESGHGLIKVGGNIVPFINKFPTNTKLYRLMTTTMGE